MSEDDAEIEPGGSVGDADAVDVALDNDIILKAVCFCLTGDFWPSGTRLGVLGAAPYVIARALTRPRVHGETGLLRRALVEFLDRTTTLEPTEAEATFAGELEYLAVREQLEFDTGEAQLAAIVVERAIAALHTGDKRAIAALEQLLALDPRLEALVGRVYCLEQLLSAVVGGGEDGYARARDGICAEPELDTTCRICFACGRANPGSDAVAGALASYINDLRSAAESMLAA